MKKYVCQRLILIFLLFSFSGGTLAAATPSKTGKSVSVEKKSKHKRKAYAPPAKSSNVKTSSEKKGRRKSGSTRKNAPSKKAPEYHISTPNRVVSPSAPTQFIKNQTGPVVVIDPGHGGFDLGATSHTAIEKILCLSTAAFVKKHLQALGYRVIMTRTRDVFLSLSDRANIANKVRGKLFLSIHYNAAKNTAASGIEIYYYGSGDQYRARESKKAATLVLGKMLQSTGAVSRGVKRGNFHVIRETRMPAILVEGGFITNDGDRDLLSEGSYREKMAKAIAEGVDKYFKALH